MKKIWFTSTLGVADSNRTDRIKFLEEYADKAVEKVRFIFKSLFDVRVKLYWHIFIWSFINGACVCVVCAPACVFVYRRECPSLSAGARA